LGVPKSENRSNHGWLVPLVVVLLVASGSLTAFYYLQYTQSNDRIATLDSTISTLKNEQSTLLQLLAANSTAPGGHLLPGNLSSIDTVVIYDYANESVVTVQGLQPVRTLFGTTYQQVLGSGFVAFYRGSYYVTTNFHVVQNDINITATFSDGDAFRANVVGSDPYSDLAILSVPGVPSTSYHPLTFASSSTLRVGQPVVAIGNPYGLSGSLTEGLVSQLGRTIRDSTAGNFSIANVIQISTPINPGNSGGPLLNAAGQVVGMTTAVVSGSQGIGFAIPSDTIIKELPYLISTGSYNLHPYLGITEADMNYDLGKASGTNVTHGVLIQTIVQGGPAAMAGLRAGTTQKTVGGAQYYIGGDIIVSVNGTRVGNGDALSTWLEEHGLPGHVVQLGIIRSGTYMTVSLTLGTRPPP
jgi:S1-C subfamily serine protease